MPTSTDLVTDLPSDFEVFGQAVDTQLKALNPSTTLGDIEYRSSTANTNTRLGIGSTGQVLTVAGGVPSWATAAGGTDTWTTVASSALSGLNTLTISSLTYSKLIIATFDANSAAPSADFELRFNGSSTAADYDQVFKNTTYNASANEIIAYKGVLTRFDVSDAGLGGLWVNVFNAKSTSKKQVSWIGGSNTTGDKNKIGYGNFNNANAITSLTVSLSGGSTWSAGTLFVYGA